VSAGPIEFLTSQIPARSRGGSLRGREIGVCALNVALLALRNAARIKRIRESRVEGERGIEIHNRAVEFAAAQAAKPRLVSAKVFLGLSFMASP